MAEDKKQDTKGSLNTLLVILLIIASFLIGSLWTNVQYLKKGNRTDSNIQNTKQAIVNNNNNQKVPLTPTAQNGQANPTIAQDVIPPITKDDYFKGNKNAKIAIIEYSDFECPYCKSYHSTMQQLMQTYSDRVIWVYRHFPLSFHQNAQKEAEAAECAGSLGGNEMFWKFTDEVYERTTSNGTGFSLDKLVPLAEELGLDKTQFKTCLDTGKFTNKVKEQQAGGANAGINGTPGTIVSDLKTGASELVSGAVPIEQLKAEIDSLK